MTLKFENHKREAERQIIVLLVEDLLGAGFELGVNNREEIVLTRSRDEAEVFAKMSTTDEDFLLVFFDGNASDTPDAWVRLVYGNDGSVISDYTTNIPEPVFERADTLARRFQGCR